VLYGRGMLEGRRQRGVWYILIASMSHTLIITGRAVNTVKHVCI
jgi:hypothetical protein